MSIPMAIKLEKKNINFNNNKDEIIIQKKVNKNNKIRSNSLNNAIKRNNNNYDIKNLTNRNTIKENSFPFLNEIPLIKDLDKIDYQNLICKTFQNYNKSQKIINNNNLNGNSTLKEIKIKEMTLFLKKCKVGLDEVTFNKIFQLFQDYKNKVINDEIIIQKIDNYLKNNDELLNLFKSVIS